MYSVSNTVCSLRMMLFLFGLPIVQCTLYNLAIGRDPEGLRIAVVNHELEHGLADCAHLPATGCHLDLPLSCRYVQQIRAKTLSVVCDLIEIILRLLCFEEPVKIMPCSATDDLPTLLLRSFFVGVEKLYCMTNLKTNYFGKS